MPWYIKIFFFIQAALLVYLVIAFAVKLIERSKESKRDKYKNIKY